jgi:hypothetical protein
MAVEFIDCASLAISYDATGKATVSMTVIRDDSQEISYSSYTNRTWGSRSFSTVITNASQKPIIGSGGWNQWSVQMEGVAN